MALIAASIPTWDTIVVAVLLAVSVAWLIVQTIRKDLLLAIAQAWFVLVSAAIFFLAGSA